MKMSDKKKKFLEDYFSLCVEHGFCIDCGNDNLYIEDWPQYIGINMWKDIKDELMERIHD